MWAMPEDMIFTFSLVAMIAVIGVYFGDAFLQKHLSFEHYKLIEKVGFLLYWVISLGLAYDYLGRLAAHELPFLNTWLLLGCYFCFVPLSMPYGQRRGTEVKGSLRQWLPITWLILVVSCGLMALNLWGCQSHFLALWMSLLFCGAIALMQIAHFAYVRKRYPVSEMAIHTKNLVD